MCGNPGKVYEVTSAGLLASCNTHCRKLSDSYIWKFCTTNCLLRLKSSLGFVL